MKINFGAQLKGVRKLLGLNIEEFGKRIGKNESQIRAYEAGLSTNPGINLIEEISEKIKVPNWYFVENLTPIEFVRMQECLEYAIYLSKFPEPFRSHHQKIIFDLFKDFTVKEAMSKNSILNGNSQGSHSDEVSKEDFLEACKRFNLKSVSAELSNNEA